MQQIQIRDEFDNPLVLLNVRLGVNGQDCDGAYDDRFTDFAGNTSWPNPLASLDGYSLFVNQRNINPNYDPFTIHLSNAEWMNPNGPLNPDKDLHIKLKRASLPRITMDGYYASKFIKGESAFLDYERFLRGEDITPLLKQSLSLESNCRRNFFMTVNTAVAGGLPPFNPEDYGDDFYQKLPDFAALYGRAGLYLYAAIFPDNKLIPSWADKTAKQVAHWNKLGEICKSIPNVFALELTNEIDAHDFNSVDANAFNKISGVLCCSGSRGPTGADPMPNPQWDFCDYHEPRNYPTTVVDCCVANHPSRLFEHRPVMLGEPAKFGNKALDSRCYDDSRIAKEISGTSMGTALGIIYHTYHGPFSQLYDGIEMTCGEEWFDTLSGV